MASRRMSHAEVPFLGRRKIEEKREGSHLGGVKRAAESRGRVNR